MRASDIRELAISDESAIVAAALFEKTVQIWSWTTGQQLGEFKTVFSFGGRRLALTPDGSICIAGGWGRGLAAYSVPDGRILWHRRDIHRVQTVRLSGSGREIYCGVEASPAHILVAATGEHIGRVRAAIGLYGSRYTSHRMIVKKGRYEVHGETEFKVPAWSFGLLDATFSPEALCLSEPGNFLHPSEATAGIRSIDLTTGNLLWHLSIGSNHLAFNSMDQKFYCAGSELNAPRKTFLIRLASRLQDCDHLAALDKCWNGAFTPSGKVFVTAQGDVYETSSGTLLAHLAFPQRDYPDARPAESGTA
jgi:hypothetical protein